MTRLYANGSMGPKKANLATIRAWLSSHALVGVARRYATTTCGQLSHAPGSTLYVPRVSRLDEMGGRLPPPVVAGRHRVPASHALEFSDDTRADPDNCWIGAGD